MKIRKCSTIEQVLAFLNNNPVRLVELNLPDGSISKALYEILYEDLAPANQVARFLTASGDGLGVHDFVGDCSGAGALQARLLVPANQIYEVDRLTVYVEGAAGALSPGEYGDLGIPLPNGVGLRVQQALITLLDLTAGAPILVNGQWVQFGAIPYWIDAGAGVYCIQADINLRVRDQPLVLTEGQALEVVLQDNFTGLVHHTFFAHGWSRAEL